MSNDLTRRGSFGVAGAGAVATTTRRNIARTRIRDDLMFTILFLKYLQTTGMPARTSCLTTRISYPTPADDSKGNRPTTRSTSPPRSGKPGSTCLKPLPD